MPQKNSRTSSSSSSDSSHSHSFQIKGEDLLKEIKKLIHEGNIRKIIIKDDKGKKTYLEIPVTLGVIGTLLAPALAAVGALAAMVGLVTVEVEKHENIQNSPNSKKQSVKAKSGMKNTKKKK